MPQNTTTEWGSRPQPHPLKLQTKQTPKTPKATRTTSPSRNNSQHRSHSSHHNRASVQASIYHRTPPNATLTTPLPKPETATGVSRVVLVPSPSCRKHVVRPTTSPRARATLSQPSARNYLAVSIVPPTRDSFTAQNSTRMILQVMHETRLTPSS